MSKDQTQEIEGWGEKKSILIIMAHPDDPEFFCGGMIARWCDQGHEVKYVLLTKGQKGSQDISANPAVIARTRIAEQKAAAEVLGVKKIHYLEFEDGEIIPDLESRNELVCVIREEKPDIVLTTDPRNLFPRENRINHPDHRATGQLVVDAIFPAAGNPHYKSSLKYMPASQPHNVSELWLTMTLTPNIHVDLTEYFEIRFQAIGCHKSQIQGNHDALKNHLSQGMVVDQKSGEQRYIEKFQRIKLK